MLYVYIHVMVYVYIYIIYICIISDILSQVVSEMYFVDHLRRCFEAVLRLVAQGSLRRKDSDQDGALSFEEFWEGDAADEEQQGSFQLLDRDGDGSLSAVELMDWESGLHHTELAFQDVLARRHLARDFFNTSYFV